MMTAPRLLTLCVVACVSSAAAAAAPRLLLHVETATTVTSPCQNTTTDTSIYRDGLLVMKSVRQDGLTTFIRAQAPPRAMKDLGKALNDHDVDTAHGNCALDVFRPNEFFTTTISWFGASSRSNTFTVTSPTGLPCPDAENGVYSAIQRAMAAALANPVGRDVVETRLQPEPGCGADGS